MRRYDKVKAWHFVRKNPNGCPVLRDGRLAVLGLRYTHEGPLELCESGLHASTRAVDALRYAPGSVACRVECSGRLRYGYDKLVCSARTILAMDDAEELLWRFACDCAARAIELYGSDLTEDQRDACWTAIAMRLAWLEGLADDQMLRDAASAATAAYFASAAAYASVATAAAAADADADAAAAAADAAAATYAYYAAYAAAAAAAGNVRDYARVDERDAQNDELERRLQELLGLKGTTR